MSIFMHQDTCHTECGCILWATCLTERLPHTIKSLVVSLCVYSCVYGVVYLFANSDTKVDTLFEGLYQVVS